MKIKPLTQLREIVSKALSDQTNLSKSLQSGIVRLFQISNLRLIMLRKIGVIRNHRNNHQVRGIGLCVQCVYFHIHFRNCKNG